MITSHIPRIFDSFGEQKETTGGRLFLFVIELIIISFRNNLAHLSSCLGLAYTFQGTYLPRAY